jgi:hypothetical protein
MAWTLPESADAPVRPRGRGSFTPGNFKKDATVRPSHGRPHGHRPIVRPSVRPSENVRVTTLANSKLICVNVFVFKEGRKSHWIR